MHVELFVESRQSLGRAQCRHSTSVHQIYQKQKTIVTNVTHTQFPFLQFLPFYLQTIVPMESAVVVSCTTYAYTAFWFFRCLNLVSSSKPHVYVTIVSFTSPCQRQQICRSSNTFAQKFVFGTSHANDTECNSLVYQRPRYLGWVC
ncbi:Hypothetical_protein [Hexamita inflata]|uniref:Hypothetical_protein n=1 Tax=Hexamita inflata TaxID=28002 RepID=A0AA86UT23_9EUKA|nr:Hypothetical protein HINF_LOCUS51407 [Hexamita inflata]